jgi:hypothetical protein
MRWVTTSQTITVGLNERRSIQGIKHGPALIIGGSMTVNVFRTRPQSLARSELPG